MDFATEHPEEGGGELRRGRIRKPRNGCVKSFSEQVSEQFSCPEGELGWTNTITCPSEDMVSFHQQKIMALCIWSTIRQPSCPGEYLAQVLSGSSSSASAKFSFCWLSPHPCLKIKKMLVCNSREGSGEERKGEGEADLCLSGRGCDTLSLYPQYEMDLTFEHCLIFWQAPCALRKYCSIALTVWTIRIVMF